MSENTPRNAGWLTGHQSLRIRLRHSRLRNPPPRCLPGCLPRRLLDCLPRRVGWTGAGRHVSPLRPRRRPSPTRACVMKPPAAIGHRCNRPNRTPAAARVVDRWNQMAVSKTKPSRSCSKTANGHLGLETFDQAQAVPTTFRSSTVRTRSPVPRSARHTVDPLQNRGPWTLIASK